MTPTHPKPRRSLSEKVLEAALYGRLTPAQKQQQFAKLRAAKLERIAQKDELSAQLRQDGATALPFELTLILAGKAPANAEGQ